MNPERIAENRLRENFVSFLLTLDEHPKHIPAELIDLLPTHLQSRIVSFWEQGKDVPWSEMAHGR